ncbi:MAG: cupredoxin domain-containing protein [Chloroflexota bacterium]
MAHPISRKGLPWVIFGMLALGVALFPLPLASAAPMERTFRIQASRFAYTPAVLAINPGDRVTVEVVATDVVHGLSIDGYNQQTTADPGQTARLTFVAGKQGSFRFRCTVTCGNMHPFMIGKLEVGQNALLWKTGALMGLALLAVSLGFRK